MSSNIPIVRQVAWISMIPQLAFMALLILGFYSVKADNPFVYGAVTYLFISFGLRSFIPRDHNKGMALVKQEKYQEAIPHFEMSYHFFKRYIWLDKYRYLTLLSASKISYREMALVNIAFCYGKTGDGLKSKQFYKKTLLEFPDSGMAKAGVNSFNSADENSI